MEVIRFRCPNCERSYFSEKGELAKYEGKRVEYECGDCSAIFWLADHLSFKNDFASQDSGFLPTFMSAKIEGSSNIGAIDGKLEFAIEPKDSQKTSNAEQFGSIGSQFSESSKNVQKKSEIDSLMEIGKKGQRGEAPEASDRLKERWQRILNNYERLELHDEFVTLAFDDNAVAYAAYQYNEMRNIKADDRIARKMIHRIEERSLLKHSLRAAARPRGVVSKIRFHHLIFLLSGTMAAIGLFDPALRNMLALSAALFVMGVGFKWVFSS